MPVVSCKYGPCNKFILTYSTEQAVQYEACGDMLLMDRVLGALSEGIEFSGDIETDVVRFLTHHHHPKTAAHCGDVAIQAVILAEKFGVNPQQARVAAWLHDVSAIIPNAQRIAMAQGFGLEVLPEEERLPMILHQKLSVVFARHLFGVEDTAILSAIGCHTTLKPEASPLDSVVFVADKIAWDQVGKPPYIKHMMVALDQSIDHAALVYLTYLWKMRDQLKVLHPWAHDAYLYLCQSLESSGDKACEGQ